MGSLVTSAGRDVLGGEVRLQHREPDGLGEVREVNLKRASNHPIRGIGAP